jgi:hypothetical protein
MLKPSISSVPCGNSSAIRARTSPGQGSQRRHHPRKPGSRSSSPFPTMCFATPISATWRSWYMAGCGSTVVRTAKHTRNTRRWRRRCRSGRDNCETLLRNCRTPGGSTGSELGPDASILYFQIGRNLPVRSATNRRSDRQKVANLDWQEIAYRKEVLKIIINEKN